MITFHVTNVNQALAVALAELTEKGEVRSSRNGTVLAFKEPVSTVYANPTHRVLFSPMRNANPAFHLLESLWMLAGRNDVEFPSTFVKNMKSFTDDGKTYWGAYGYRWRNFFGWDQIEMAIDELKRNPESRRVVLAMWNGMETHECGVTQPPDFIVGMNGGKDVPCNTHIYLDLRGGVLNMLVSCRSNDIIWGAYGANAVHMSVLQEYIALSVGVPVGVYTQMSNDLHLYNATAPKQGLMALSEDADKFNYYKLGYEPLPLWNSAESKEMFDSDLVLLFSTFDNRARLSDLTNPTYQTEFFKHVVQPMLTAWIYRKSARVADHQVYKIASPDWAMAMTQWIGAQK